jgi:hypothetical protein
MMKMASEFVEDGKHPEYMETDEDKCMACPNQGCVVHAGARDRRMTGERVAACIQDQGGKGRRRTWPLENERMEERRMYKRMPEREDQRQVKIHEGAERQESLGGYGFLMFSQKVDFKKNELGP